jgi:hypothetical protein
MEGEKRPIRQNGSVADALRENNVSDTTLLAYSKDTHMYVIEHVRMEISKSSLSRLRVSMADTIRATMPSVRDNHGSIERMYLQSSGER